MEHTIQTNAASASQSTKTNAPVSALPAVTTKQASVDIEKAKNEASRAIASSADDVRQAAESLKLNVERFEPALTITVDEAVDIPVVTVVDQSSNKVIRQIPNEEIVALARFIEGQNFDDYSSHSALRGVLLNDFS